MNKTRSGGSFHVTRINTIMLIDWTDYFLTRDNDELAVSMRDAKAHLSIADYDGEDELIRSYINAAANFFDGPEGFGFVLCEKEYEVELDYLPSSLRLNIAPITSLTVIQDGAEVTPIKASVRRGLFEFSGNSNPALIRLTAGHADPDTIPTDIRQAIKMLAATWYRNREQFTDKAVNNLPLGVEAIFNKYRRY